MDAEQIPVYACGGLRRASSLLAQQYHRIDRQRALRWNPRSQ